MSLFALRHSYRAFNPKPCRTSRLRQPAALKGAQQGAHRTSSSSSSRPQTPQDAPHIRTIQWLVAELEAAGATYMLTGACAALVQGVPLGPTQVPPASAEVQWDFMAPLHARLQPLGPSPIQRVPAGQIFTLDHSGWRVQLSCQLNTVLAMDPARVPVQVNWEVLVGGLGTADAEPTGQAQTVWCSSLLALRRELQQQQGSRQQHHQHQQQGQELEEDLIIPTHPLLAAVIERLAQMQAEFSRQNSQAWAQDNTFDAWVARFGTPADAAARIAADPTLRLIPLHTYLPADLTGCRMANLLGSHGIKAVALALLGADVTVVDVSPGNAQYARQLAAAAGVELRYEVCDVLQLPPQLLDGGFDVVLMELGVLHYFLDLAPLLDVAARLLRPGGLLLLRDFHPISTKLITSKGKKHKVTGNYFTEEAAVTSVAYSKHARGSATADSKGAGIAAPATHGPEAVRLRQWTLGEVVTAVCAAGFNIQTLTEEPGNKLDDFGLPKLYTISASKHV